MSDPFADITLPAGWILGTGYFWPFKIQTGAFTVRVTSITYPNKLGGRKRTRDAKRAAKHFGAKQ